MALSSDGQTLAVGAPTNSDNGGYVRVYAWSGSAWGQLGDNIDAEAADDQLGHSVALSSDGRTLAVGARTNDGNGSNAGHVRVYELTTTAPPQISGTPSEYVISGAAYSFSPTASDADNDTLVFSVANLPTWASFNTSTGAITGTPAANDAGTATDIVITVSDGTLTANLQPFDITVLLDTDGDGDPDSCNAGCQGAGYNEDTDDDNDGVPDTLDALPLDETETVDTDGDGTGNNADTDDDNDGLSDSEESQLGTDPLLADTDGDGWSDKEEIEEGSDPLSEMSEPEISTGLPIWLLYQATQ